MRNWKPTILRYILGDLPEEERAALEERYFSDSALFEEVARVEAALLDDAARGRLDPETRRRFEEFYLADPERRERAAFARALVSKVDAAHPVRTAGDMRQRSGTMESLLAALGGPRPALGLALGMLVVASSLVWYAFESRRSVPGAAPPPNVAPAPGPSAPAHVVTLALLIEPGARSGGAATPTPLVIPPGTTDVRLELRLGEHDYPAYRVVMRQLGGLDLLRTGDLIPATSPAGPAVVLTFQAERLAAADYVLTLQGAAGDGAFEDLSQRILRVERP